MGEEEPTACRPRILWLSPRNPPEISGGFLVSGDVDIVTEAVVSCVGSSGGGDVRVRLGVAVEAADHPTSLSWMSSQSPRAPLELRHPNTPLRDTAQAPRVVRGAGGGAEVLSDPRPLSELSEPP